MQISYLRLEVLDDFTQSLKPVPFRRLCSVFARVADTADVVRFKPEVQHSDKPAARATWTFASNVGCASQYGRALLF
jgi:hypothetical protein